MNKYTIKIEKITEVEGEKYPKRDTVYEQTVEVASETIIKDVIKAVNIIS